MFCGKSTFRSELPTNYARTRRFSRNCRRFQLRQRPRQPSIRREPMLFHTRGRIAERSGATLNAPKSSSRLTKKQRFAKHRRFARSFRLIMRGRGAFLATVDVFSFGSARGDLQLGASLCCFIHAAGSPKGPEQPATPPKRAQSLGKMPFPSIKRRFARSFRRFRRRNGVFPATVGAFGFGGVRGNLQLGASLCCCIPAARRQKGHSQRKNGVSLGTFAESGSEASLFPAAVDAFGFGGARGNLQLGASLCCFVPAARLRFASAAPAATFDSVRAYAVSQR